MRTVLLIFAAVLASGETVPHGTLSLISRDAVVRPGGKTLLGLAFKLDAGWHIYWSNPGDSGVEPRVSWTVAPGGHVGDLLWPAPSRLNDHGLVDYGYQNSVVLLSLLEVAPGASGEVSATADVHWAVCSATCITAKAKLSKVIRIGTEAKPSPDAGAIATAERQLPKLLPAGCSAVARDEKTSFGLRIFCSSLGTDITFFPSSPNEIENAAPQETRADTAGVSVRLVKSDQLLRAPAKLEGVLETGAGRPAYQIIAAVKDLGSLK